MSLLLRHVSRSIRCGSRLTAHGNARAAQYTPRTRPAVPPRARYVTPGRWQQGSRTCRFALRQLVPQRTPSAPAESPRAAGDACRVVAYPTPPKCRAGTPLASTYAAPSVARTPGRGHGASRVCGIPTSLLCFSGCSGERSFSVVPMTSLAGHLIKQYGARYASRALSAVFLRSS